MGTPIARPQGSGGAATAELLQSKSNEFNWVFFAVIASFHLGAIAALFTFHWTSLIMFVGMWLLGQNVGVAVSYHRQLTHRSFSTQIGRAHV